MRRALAFTRPRLLAGLLAALLAAAAPVQAKPRTPDYATAEWRLVRVYAPTPELQRGLDLWVLEADLKASNKKGRKRARTVRVLVRETEDGSWSVASNRYACGKGEVRVERIERFTPGAARPSVEPGGEPYPIDPGGPVGAIGRLVCDGARSDAPVVRGRAAAFALQDAADAAFARAQAAGG